MNSPRLIFRKLKGYKYDVKFSITYLLPELKHIIFENDYLRLKDGVLDIEKGYAWDGASGPTWDDKTNYRSSLVHDALYQILREADILHPKIIRLYADKLLRDMSIEDGGNKFRYKIWFNMVQLFAKRSSTPRQKPRGQIVEIL